MKNIIDNTIKNIWLNKIKFDYDNGYLLREDTLKNALYYHLRTELGELFFSEDIRIFTEYGTGIFKGTGYKPDMVIAKVNFDCDSRKYEDWITNIICVIEIKSKQGFTTSNDIYKDFDKLHKYIDKFDNDCNYYMATIWEYEDEPTSWTENAEWAKGKLTELNASFNENGDMRFYIP